MVKPNLSKGFLPSTEKKLEPGETSSGSKYLPGEPVKHLDRNKPTPKEKAAELNRATAWRGTPDEASDTVPKGNISSLQFGELGSHKNTDFVSQKIPKEFNNDRSSASFPVQFQGKGGDEVNEAANENAKASTTGVPYRSVIPGAREGPTFGLKKSFDPQVKDLQENSFITTSNGQKETTNPIGLVPSKDQSVLLHGNKPFLPSIYINRANPRAVSSDHGLGFTFPVSASSGVLSEPPTPSIMPSSSTSAPSQPKDVTGVPLYSFGTDKSTPRLIFSFPSTSSTSTPDAY
ncbi:Nuclear pore complex protein [Forsythia ovata]|uniref:Nuclear pore complex protein n=1 Tax=Forsythia ovata TaxID=205694 RepID=A0ABD1SJD0_9LAMI